MADPPLRMPPPFFEAMLSRMVLESTRSVPLLSMPAPSTALLLKMVELQKVQRPTRRHEHAAAGRPRVPAGDRHAVDRDSGVGPTATTPNPTLPRLDHRSRGDCRGAGLADALDRDAPRDRESAGRACRRHEASVMVAPGAAFATAVLSVSRPGAIGGGGTCALTGAAASSATTPTNAIEAASMNIPRRRTRPPLVLDN